MLLILALFVIRNVAATCFSRFDKLQFSNCIEVPAAPLSLHWNIDLSPSTNTSRNATISFGVDYAKGMEPGQWLGLGFSERGGMRGADLFVLRYTYEKQFIMQVNQL